MCVKSQYFIPSFFEPFDSPVLDLGLWASHWGLPLLTSGHDYYDEDREFNMTVYAGPAGLDLLVGRLHRNLSHISDDDAFAFSHSAQDFGQYFNMLSNVGRHQMGSPDLVARIVAYSRPDEAVRFIRAKGKVAYIHGSPEMLQQIMGLAQAQNMTNGDYVFFYLDLFKKSLQAEGHREAAKPWQNKEGRDAGNLREAFQQTLLVITFHGLQTSRFQRFQTQLILRAQKDFGVALDDSVQENVVAACFHDMLLLYIRALIETLQEGGTKRNTSRILEKMRGLKIQGVTGMVSINSMNSREMDFDLWAMVDVESGEYQVVGQYVGSEQRIKWLRPIHWKEEELPYNSSCVFGMDGASCASLGSHISLKSSIFVVISHLELWTFT